MPLVSFIIPCYRQAHYLPFAVKSALKQTIGDVEVIVIDDGSPDDVLQALAEFAHDVRVRCVRQENAGLPAARNRGIRESQGRYLNFLDADDWLHEEFAAELSDVLQADSTLGFAYSDLQHTFDGAPQSDYDKDYSAGASRRQTSGDILPSLLLGGYFPPCCALIPRAVLDEVGFFNEELGGHADWELWLRISVRGWPAQYVDKRLAFYRIHDGSMSRHSGHMRTTQFATLRKLFRDYPERSAEGIGTLITNLTEAHRVNLRLGAECAKLNEEYRDLQSLREQDLLRSATLFEEQNQWITKLEEAKNWHERQSKHWEAETQHLAEFVKSQGDWIAQLAARKEELERESAAINRNPAIASPE